MHLRPRKNRGTIAWQPRVFGRSHLGCPLEVWDPDQDCQLLLFAGIHGEEAESTFLLSRALRLLNTPSPHCAVVLAMNPDGLIRGTRGNARGVELNRNFPSNNWQPDPVPHRSSMTSPRDIMLSPGSEPGSEPETQALLALIEELKPRSVIALHAPLGCIEDPLDWPLAQWLSDRSGLPKIKDVGYATPGSFGSWAAENQLHVITYELPLLGPSQIVEQQSPMLFDLLIAEDLTGFFPA